MKKIIALILAVALMLGAMPFAFAAEYVHEVEGESANTMRADCITHTPGYKYVTVTNSQTGERVTYTLVYCMVCGDTITTVGKPSWA